MKGVRAIIWPMMALAAVAYAQDKGPRQIKDSDLKGLSWRSIGPANMGGRVADICFVPGSSKSFYVAFGIGGVWKTNNFGTTFSPIFDHEVTNSVGAVVVSDAPTNWSGWDKDTKPADREKQGEGKIVWVGTGEGNGRNSSSWGHGVYRSTDGGQTWTNALKPANYDGTRDLQSAYDDPSVMLAATQGNGGPAPGGGGGGNRTKSKPPQVFKSTD